MRKTLHIIPSGNIWPRIVGKWIGEGPDKSEHEVTQYPVHTNLHYQPDALTDVEMMKTAISWYKPNSYPVANLYQDLKNFIETVKKGPEFDKVFVWHAEDADSRLLLYLIAYAYKHRFYAVDITPKDRRFKWKVNDDVDSQFEDVKVYTDSDVDIDSITRDSFEPGAVTQKTRKEFYEIWKSWGGEDALGSPVLVNQFGTFLHPYRIYLYQDVFAATPKDHPESIGAICEEIHTKHPQISHEYIHDTIVQMADSGLVKWVKKEENNQLGHLLQQYKYDVEGEWNRYPHEFLHEFEDLCGKKIRMSEDDRKAEFLRARKDHDDMFCKGHLAREDRSKKREHWHNSLVIRWAAAFNENWGWYHLMSVMKVKLGMMAEYMREWSYIANGPVYAYQMERAIRLMEVILDYGGESEYRRDEGDEPCLDSEHFSRYVNFRNRERFIGPDCDSYNFWCDAQRLRFIKAWNILWEMFRTKLLDWED